MEESELLYEKLKEAVENTASREMRTPKDFDFLSMRIFDTTKSQLSPTTLKRFWGYLKNECDVTPRLITLNILSLFVGYTDWQAFCQSACGINEVESGFLNNPFLYTTSLKRGDMLTLLWHPNRYVKICLRDTIYSPLRKRLTAN